MDGPAAPIPLLLSEVALKSAAETIGGALQADPATIESKPLAKVRAHPGWALEKHAKLDTLQILPKADPSKPGDGASLAEKKRAF